MPVETNTQDSIIPFAMSSLRILLSIPSAQVPISTATFVSYVIPLVVSYIAMAMLAITPGTRALRVALWPVLTLLALRTSFVDWSQGRPEQVFINGELVRFIICIPPHALSWTFAKKPLVRHLRPVNSSPSVIMDALDLATNLRGIGWDWSQGLYIPRETRPTGNRMVFGFYALLSVIAKFMISIVVVRAIHTLTAGAGSGPQSFTIFDKTLPFFVRYLRSSVITVLAGFMAYNGLQAVYHLFTVLGILFGQDPAQWPPGLENPWCATSLTEFWGRRWQQWLRHTFIVCAYPLYVVFGRPGKIVGAFLASGLAHHLILVTHDRHSEMWRMFVGFGMMAPGMLAERAFYKTTGRKVGGVTGWVWTISWLIVWYSLVVEGFIKAGLYTLPVSAGQEPLVWAQWIDSLVKGFDVWLHTI